MARRDIVRAGTRSGGGRGEAGRSSLWDRGRRDSRGGLAGGPRGRWVGGPRWRLGRLLYRGGLGRPRAGWLRRNIHQHEHLGLVGQQAHAILLDKDAYPPGGESTVLIFFFAYPAIVDIQVDLIFQEARAQRIGLRGGHNRRGGGPIQQRVDLAARNFEQAVFALGGADGEDIVDIALRIQAKGQAIAGIRAMLIDQFCLIEITIRIGSTIGNTVDDAGLASLAALEDHHPLLNGIFSALAQPGPVTRIIVELLVEGRRALDDRHDFCGRKEHRGRGGSGGGGRLLGGRRGRRERGKGGGG